MSKYVVYVDGACKKTLVGGWAYVILDGEEFLYLNESCGREENTTNNRMELLAAIKALKCFEPRAELTIFSDSAYVVNCFKDKWYIKWEKNHWQGSMGPVKNPDLWEELLRQHRKFTISPIWTHVKGHSGNRWNDRADQLASGVAK